MMEAPPPLLHSRDHRMPTARSLGSTLVLVATCAGCAGAGGASEVGILKYDRPCPAPQAASAVVSRPDLPRTSQDVPDRIADDADEVSRRLDEGRQAKDVIAVVCLNDKLVPIRSAHRSALEHLQALRQALASRDDVEADRQRVFLSRLLERADRLTEEGRGCMSKEQFMCDPR